MAESKRSSSFTDIGYKPQTHEQERMMSAADRVEACLINNQPERVHLSKINGSPKIAAGTEYVTMTCNGQR